MLNPDVSVTRHSGAGKTFEDHPRKEEQCGHRPAWEGFEGTVFHKTLRRSKVHGTESRKYKHDCARARGVVRKTAEEES